MVAPSEEGLAWPGSRMWGRRSGAKGQRGASGEAPRSRGWDVPCGAGLGLLMRASGGLLSPASEVIF